MNREIGLLTIYFFLVSWNIIYGLRSSTHPQTLKLKNHYCDLGKVISLCLLVLLVFLVVHDHDNPDYSGYFRRFNNLALPGSIDLGYEQIMKWGGVLGLDFDAFRVIIYSLAYILTWIALGRLGINKNIALGLYALFPFTYDAIQIRFFLSFTIVLFSLPYLMDEKKSGLIKYIIGIVIASFLHSISIIYGLFLLVRLNGRERIRQRLLGVIFAVSLALMAYSLFHPNSAFRMILVNVFVSNASEIKVRNYLGYSWKATIMLVAQELLFLVTATINKKIVESSQEGEREQSYKLSQLIYGCNLVISCTLPLLLVTPQFLRLFRNLTLLNYGIPGILVASREKSQSKVICGFLFVLSFLSIMLWNYFMGDSLEEVFWPFFNGI